MKTILLTGARAPVTLDLARALNQQGHRVIGAESMPYPLSIHSNAFANFYQITAPNESLEEFQKNILHIVAQEKVDLIIPTCEEAFHLSRIRDSLLKHTDVLVDQIDKLEQLHSKFQFNALSIPLNFAAPKSYRVTSIAEAQAAIEAVPGAQVVLKPDFSRFASKTLVVEKSMALSLIAGLSLKNGTAWVVQECLKGPEYCTYSVAIHGKLISHVTYDHEFTAGRGAGISFQAIDHPAIESWVRAFVQKTDFHGQLAFDFIETSTGVVLPLECNPRATSGLHLIAHEKSFIENLIHFESAEKLTFTRPKVGTSGQLRLAMLVYGLASINSPQRAWHWLKVFFTAREVVFSAKDPRPFFDQFVTFFHLVLQAKRRKITALEVSTRDIEWNGKQPQA